MCISRKENVDKSDETATHNNQTTSSTHCQKLRLQTNIGGTILKAYRYFMNFNEPNFQVGYVIKMKVTTYNNGNIYLVYVCYVLQRVGAVFDFGWYIPRGSGHHCGSENIGLSYNGKWLSEVPTSSTVSLLLKKDVVKSFWYTGPGRHNNLLGMGHFDDSNHRERLQNLS